MDFLTSSSSKTLFHKNDGKLERRLLFMSYNHDINFRLVWGFSLGTTEVTNELNIH